MTTPLFPIEIKPDVGIERDGTSFDTTRCTDGSWNRFYKERPQSIGGYIIIDNGTEEIIRNLFSVNSQNSVIVYIGRNSGLSYITLYPDLTASGEINITPAGYVPNPDGMNTWSFATVSYNDVDYILAIPLPNASDISNNTPGTLYAGVVGDSEALTIVTDAPPVTGGVTVSGNYILLFGSQGTIFWNDGNGFSTSGNWPIQNKIVFESTQFVAGAPVRSGQTLSALFWSLDFVTLLSLSPSASDPTVNTFTSSYVSTESTLLSANSIISLDPYFYWPGNNSFYQFNASVIELENTINKEWFFSNLNREEKEKVFGFVDRIYNEIWFLFPYGTATENTNAIFANVDNPNQPNWQDTDQIPRSCAISSSTQFPYPLMASSQPIRNGTQEIFPIWAHEYGTDKVQLGQNIAITKSFETNWMYARDIDPSMTVCILDTLIPDIKQQGDMTVQFKLRGYPNSPPVLSPIFTIPEGKEFLTIRQEATIFSAVFTSNVLGGAYLMGRTQLLAKAAGSTRPGPSAS